MPDYSFRLANARIGTLDAEGRLIDSSELVPHATLKVVAGSSAPDHTITFSRADLAASAELSATWTYPLLTHRQYRQISMLLFGRKRYSNKIEHNIARRQARTIAKLHKRYSNDFDKPLITS